MESPREIAVRVTVLPVGPSPIIQAVREGATAPPRPNVTDSQRWLGRFVRGFHDYWGCACPFGSVHTWPHAEHR